MKSNIRKFKKNDAGFTGLEAAIVLIAFVVVAAVFSYVMLGAGFFTSQKSKEVVHTGTSQATSSIELAGDVVGHGKKTGAVYEMNYVKVVLQLTAGNNPIDMSKTVVSYRSDTDYENNIFTYTDGGRYHIDTWDGFPRKYSYKWISTNQGSNGDADSLLERFEKIELNLDLENAGLSTLPQNNDKVYFEIKPPVGATLAIQGTVPAAFDNNGVFMLI